MKDNSMTNTLQLIKANSKSNAFFTAYIREVYLEHSLKFYDKSM